jgi:hypothetical protein
MRSPFLRNDELNFNRETKRIARMAEIKTGFEMHFSAGCDELAGGD